MTEDKAQQSPRVVSDLNNELEALKKENEILHKMLAITTKQRERYAAIEAENKVLKNEWRMTFAGQAMTAHMTALSNANIENWNDEIAKLSFLTADSMLLQISI